MWTHWKWDTNGQSIVFEYPPPEKAKPGKTYHPVPAFAFASPAELHEINAEYKRHVMRKLEQV